MLSSFIFRKRFSPKFLWSLGLHKGSSNWFQIIYGRVNHLMTSINNATFQLWRRIDSKEPRKKSSNTIKTLHETHFSSWKTPFDVQFLWSNDHTCLEFHYKISPIFESFQNVSCIQINVVAFWRIFLSKIMHFFESLTR